MCKLDRGTEILYCIFQVKILNCQCHPCFLPGWQRMLKCTFRELRLNVSKRRVFSVRWQRWFDTTNGPMLIIAGVVCWFWRSFVCCTPKSLWRFSQSGRVPRRFWNRAPKLGWRHECTIVSGFFTATLMIFQHRSSETYRYTEEDFATFWKLENLRKLCKKTKSQIFASGFGLFSLYISIYVPVLSELRHLSFRRILQFETMLQWREKRQSGRKYSGLKESIYVPSEWLSLNRGGGLRNQ